MTADRMAKSIRKNFAFNAVRIALGMLFPLVTFPYVSRVLSPEGIGRVGFASSLVAYFLMISAAGIPLYGMREASVLRDNRKKLSALSSELLVINLIFTAVAYLLLAGAVVFVPALRADAVLIAITAIGIVFAAIGMEWLYQGLEEYVYITIRSLLFQVIFIGLLFFVVKKESDYLRYAGLFALSGIGINLSNFLHARTFIDLSFRGLKLVRHLRPVMVMFVMNIASSVYLNLNTVMLGFMSTKDAVGIYGASLKVVQMAVLFIASLGTVLLPRSSYYVKQGRVDDFRRLVDAILSFVLMIGFPAAVGIIALRVEIIALFAGDAFARSADVLALLAPNVLLTGITGIIGIQILIPLGKERYTVYSVAAGVLVNCALNAALIPRWGETGAAISVCAAECAVLAFQIVCVRKVFPYRFSLLRCVPYVAGSAAVFGVVYAARHLVHGTVPVLCVAVAGSVAVYGVVLLLFRDPLVLMILRHFGDLARVVIRRGR